MYSELGIIMRKLRIDKGETQKDMANTMGISSTYISMIERGTRPAPDGFVEKLADRYKLTPAERRSVIRAASTVSVVNKFSTC